MPKVVFEMIASILEDVVILVLDFPVCPTQKIDDGHNGFVGDQVVGGEGIVVENLTVSAFGDGHLAPIDH